MALHVVEALASELHPALQTSLVNISGTKPPWCPKQGPIAVPRYLQCTEPRVWFHDPPPLATVRGSICCPHAVLCRES